jgi:hypothetical protein
VRRALPLALLAAVAAPATAQPNTAKSEQVDEARLTAARELLRVQGVGVVMQKMYRDLAPAMALSVIGEMATDNDGKLLLERIEQRGDGAKGELARLVAEEFLASMTRRIPQLLERFAAEYARSFTQKELDDALAFFASPSGARFVELQPQMQERGREIGMDLGRDAGREAVEAALKRFEKGDTPPAVHPGT